MKNGKTVQGSSRFHIVIIIKCRQNRSLTFISDGVSRRECNPCRESGSVSSSVAAVRRGGMALTMVLRKGSSASGGGGETGAST